ncbi:hypothetical protein LNP04_09440 [Chryseobacterium sp. C-71]|uniref:hypothetical protein n=1 Tax=Chryseobacterium sp. C-71 TaxID=2893882 RepID=UPI001E46EF59|nr:hypothetical protein [Chryseobacterium sp. C-71]UFH33899.1 hypothetical protein LNP04_09440 [Chryseobacterium sp. C-71]
MKSFVFIFIFQYTYLYSQKYEKYDQIFFIGERIKTRHLEIKRSYKLYQSSRKDCEIDKDDNCYPDVTKSNNFRIGTESYTTYKIIKLLKGKYDKDTVEYISIKYHEELPIFESQQANKSKYALIGIYWLGGKWFQSFAEKVYPTENHRWILPYKDTYPFINYEKLFPEKLRRSERVKIITDDTFYNIKHYSKPNLVTPYYRKKEKYAIVTKAFVF